MNQTRTLFPMRFDGSWHGFALMVIALGALAILASCASNSIFAQSGAVTPESVRSALPDGISIAGQITDQDIVFLQDMLQLLRNDLPEWYTYVVEAKPFVLSIGLTENKEGVAADATCCDDQGNSKITFDDHLGLLTASASSEDQTMQARQVLFLSTLIHEVTHLRDHRAGRIPKPINAVACISAEEAAYTKEFEFKRAVISATFANCPFGADYRAAAQRQFDAEESQFNRQFWKFYCLLAQPNNMDD